MIIRGIYTLSTAKPFKNIVKSNKRRTNFCKKDFYIKFVPYLYILTAEL